MSTTSRAGAQTARQVGRDRRLGDYSELNRAMGWKPDDEAATVAGPLFTSARF
jgi:hypothetical protein